MVNILKKKSAVFPLWANVRDSEGHRLASLENALYTGPSGIRRLAHGFRYSHGVDRLRLSNARLYCLVNTGHKPDNTADARLLKPRGEREKLLLHWPRGPPWRHHGLCSRDQWAAQGIRPVVRGSRTSISVIAGAGVLASSQDRISAECRLGGRRQTGPSTHVRGEPVLKSSGLSRRASCPNMCGRGAGTQGSPHPLNVRPCLL